MFIKSTKKCEHCGKQILDSAKKCRFCGEWCEEREQKCPFCKSVVPLGVMKCPQCASILKRERSNLLTVFWVLVYGITFTIAWSCMLVYDLDDGALFAWVLILLSIGFYLLPSTIADNRRHKFTVLIFILNLLLGYTVIGWIVTFVWAFIDSK